MAEEGMDDFIKNDKEDSEVKDKKEETKMEKEEKIEDDEGEGINFWKLATIVLAIALVASVFTGFSINDITGSTSVDVPAGSDPEIQMLVVNDPDCTLCDTTQIVQTTKTQIFPSAVITEIDYDSKEGKELIEKYEIDMLPAYLFSLEVEEAENFAQLQNVLIDKGDLFLIDPAAAGAAKTLSPPEAGDAPSKGDLYAPVTIFEFSEFKCPYCAAVSGFNDDVMDYLKQGDPSWTPAVPKIMEEYVKAGKVRIVFKNFIVHDSARMPAQAGLCADDQGKFWEMHDMMFENQDDISDEKLQEFAEELELDMDEFNECLDSGKYADKIDETTAEGRAVGISGTPGFVVNDMIVSGARGFEDFKQIIDALLAE